MITPKVRRVQSAPWFSEELKDLQRIYRRQERKWLLNKSHLERGKLREALGKYKAAIKLAKTSHFSKVIRGTLNSSKELFNTVRALTSSSSVFSPLENSPQFCQSVADFFNNKITNFLTDFSPPLLDLEGKASSCYVEPVHALDSFQSLSANKICDLLMALKSGAPTDLCPPRILKLAPQLVTEALEPVFAEILQEWIFPAGCKQATVIPLIKKPGRNAADLTNLHPISLLPGLAKMLEKHLNNELSVFLQENCKLDPSQDGFRGAHSTETALISTSDIICRRGDLGEGSILVLLDLSAAFDTMVVILTLAVFDRQGGGPREHRRQAGGAPMGIPTAAVKPRSDRHHWRGPASVPPPH
ncbi:hypothetical protein NDU88_005141 [Pleurodeles waltl]|uniref:Reverse transcriptase domain-containing protein n=1 Tax=Pleurodeles waltl TaxID=8319 RepID=A0AAV7WB62_PLEWA|nr:hypothetical protein NDU88_005141 [Pleurodeles waltl]